MSFENDDNPEGAAEPALAETEKMYGLEEAAGSVTDGDDVASASSWRLALDKGRVFAHAFGAILDVAMMVIGIGLVSIAVATLLDGFGLAELSLTDSSGAMFGSAVLVGVFGSFALGVANEGPLTSPRSGDRIGLIESNIARAISIVLVSLIVGWLARLLPDLLGSLPLPFELGTTVIEQTGRAGIFFGLFLGVPIAVLVRMWRSDLPEDFDFAAIFVMWLAGTIVFVNGVV